MLHIVSLVWLSQVPIYEGWNFNIGNSVVETPRSETQESSLHHKYVTYLSYLTENEIAPKMSHAFALTFKAPIGNLVTV